MHIYLLICHMIYLSIYLPTYPSILILFTFPASDKKTCSKWHTQHHHSGQKRLHYSTHLNVMEQIYENLCWCAVQDSWKLKGLQGELHNCLGNTLREGRKEHPLIWSRRETLVNKNILITTSHLSTVRSTGALEGISHHTQVHLTPSVPQNIYIFILLTICWFYTATD